MFGETHIIQLLPLYTSPVLKYYLILYFLLVPTTLRIPIPTLSSPAYCRPPALFTPRYPPPVPPKQTCNIHLGTGHHHAFLESQMKNGLTVMD